MHSSLSNRSKIYCLLLLIILCGSLYGQSRFTLIGMSAILPGSGEIALGNTNKGIILLSSELVATYSFFKTDHDMSLQKKAYKNYALHYAGVPLDMPQGHYQAIQEYISSEEYNDFQEMMARNYYLIYYNDIQAYTEYMEANTYTGEESWEWQSAMHWETYKDMRKTHQKIKMNHNLALGIMLLNRAISIIDTAVMSNNTQLYASPNGLDGVMLNYEMRF